MKHFLQQPQLLLLLLFASFSSNAQQQSKNKRLLNAYHSPLTALTAPHTYYFLEFPIPSSNSEEFDDSNNNRQQPRCNNGGQYSFLFRRGTNEHVHKLLVEFEGESDNVTSTPWYAFQTAGYPADKDGTFVPPLGTCTGLSQGFVTLGAGLLGFDISGGSTNNVDNDVVDVPIFLRRAQTTSTTTNDNVKSWWEHLSGEYSSIHDWSYIFVPHCTPGNIHATNANIQSVSNWITSQFAQEGTTKLDALITVSGGGGCTPTSNNTTPTIASHSVSFAMDVTMKSSFKSLVLLDGTSKNDVLQDVVKEALDSEVNVAWVDYEDDDNFSQGMELFYPQSFHIHKQNEKETSETGQCPRYVFSDISADDEFVNFLDAVVKKMPWGKVTVKSEEIDANTSNDGSRLSFLAIVVIILGIYLTAWAIYFLMKLHRQRQAKKCAQEAAVFPPTPHDLWFLALTKAPTLFLLISIAIPVILSYVAYAQNGNTVSVNLDFESYLDIDTPEERVAMQYKTLLEYQKESLKVEEENCKVLYDNLDKERSFNSQRGRGLKEYTKRNGRPIVNFFYQNRDGGDIFTPSILKSIRQFELDIRAMPGFQDLCYSNDEGTCLPFDSIVSYFFPDGENLVDDIDSVLRSFSSSTKALAKMDRYFSKDNLGSNVTMTTMWLDYTDDRNDTDKGDVDEFLETLHRELWTADSTQKYPPIIISWRNDFMTDLEASDALENDFKWSLAALCFIAFMLFVKVMNVFAVLAGVLGLVLSFTSALYWQLHFDFNEMTALHVAGLFVMLGIGADDIFITIDSYEHTKVEYVGHVAAASNLGDGTSSQVMKQRLLNDPDIVKRRIVSAYKTAGSMMLISSVTTAICFYSNVLSTVVSVSDFGSYMGTVVLLNYVHVMTILPSALLVNELHIKPLQRKIWTTISWPKQTNGYEERNANPNNPLDASIDGVPAEDTLMQKNDFIENGNLAETAVALDDHDRELTTPATTMSSDEVKRSQSFDEAEASHEPSLVTPDDYNFLHHTKEMGILDRFFVNTYAPTIYKLRWAIMLISVIAAVVFGVLAWMNFAMYDGTIIVFKEKYNLGRVQRVVDQYYPEDLVKMYLDQGIEFLDISADDLSDVSVADLESAGTVSITSPTPPTPPPSPPPTAVSLSATSNSTPSSRPVPRPVTQPLPSSASSEEDESNTISNGLNDSIAINSEIAGSAGNQTPPPTTTVTNRPTRNPSSPTNNPTPAPSPAPTVSPIAQVVDNPNNDVYYPDWTGDSRGCLNDGNAPQMMLDIGFIFDTLAACCEQNFSWDPNPTNCLGVDEDQESPSSSTSTASGGTAWFISSNSSTTSPINSPTLNPTTSYSPTTTAGDQTSSVSPPPTTSNTSSPTAQPVGAKSIVNIVQPTPMPSAAQFVCPEGITNTKFCIQTSGAAKTYQKKEYFVVSVVWGMSTVESSQGIWSVRDSNDDLENLEFLLTSDSNIHPADLQEELLEIVTLARNDTTLSIHPQLTYIEALKDFTELTGIPFPIPKELYIGVVENLKAKSSFFRKLVEREIATNMPGLAGDEYFYTSVSMLSEVPLVSKGDASEVALSEWTNFTVSINDKMVPENYPPVVVQSDAFLDSLRTTAIVESTLSSYFFANGLFLVVILLFTGNLLLTSMVMVSLILILLCLAGVIFSIFKIDFGPVESLGVSIFVGLSSNYLLHIAHAYHSSKIKERSMKIQRAVFIVGSPILWSAISTIGGSAFLFACRTWLLTELGILICTVIALSFIFSMGFLLAFLSVLGPVPIASSPDNGVHDSNLHTCDLLSIFQLPFCRNCSTRKGEYDERNSVEAQLADEDDDILAQPDSLSHVSDDIDGQSELLEKEKRLTNFWKKKKQTSLNSGT